MSTEQNEEILRQVIAGAFNDGRIDVLQAHFNPAYIEHQFGLKSTIEGMHQDILSLHASFPDFSLTIDDIVVVEDKVWARMTARGTNRGGFMGPPNDKSFAAAVFDMVRFEDGKIVEHWGSPDRFAILAQLGLLPQRQA